MPDFGSYPAGTPSWVDLATPDMSASHSVLFGDLRLGGQRPRS